MVDFGLSSDEFGRLTLREFDALVRRKSSRDDLESLRFGMIAAAVYNTMRRKKSDKVFKATDFIGKKKSIQSEKEMINIVKIMDKFCNRGK